MFQVFFSKFRSSKGLTLIEILVTAGLIVFVTSLVIRNFSASRLNLEQVANVMASDIRLAQQLALSSHQYQGPNDPAPRNRCGYGVAQDPGNPQTGYIIYAGRATVDPSGNPQTCNARNYQTSQDTPAYKSVILDTRLNFRDNPGLAFKDTFFEPPGPTTYIQNSSTPSDPNDPTNYYEQIPIKKVGTPLNGLNSCVQGSLNCIYICVYFSGRVEIVKNTTSPVKCPAPF